MIRNYVTVAYRNLRRYWGYTLINVLGLAIALTCALQISAYVRHEFSYNTHLDPDNRVYRVMHKAPFNETGRRRMACITDTGLVNNLSLPSVTGDAREILRRAGAAMLTVSFAEQLFGD
jgi:hypothetical protein